MITILEDKNQKKINEFNRLYALEEKDFSDEVILSLIKKNSFDFK